MSARKRSRPVVEENRAECPFSVSYETSGRAEQDRQKSAKKRKRDGQDEEKKVTIQISPFEPAGQFKTHDTMDLHYAVEPRKRWLDMTRYNSFVLNGTKYYSEGFVYVANESTIERQRAANQGNAPPKKKEDDWVARILEIRAADEHHVYARIYWMYWPDELPVCTMNGKKTLSGRQPYHGQNELVASNHMDVINVVSVTMPATVNQWIETDDEEIQDSLYWRQAYNWRTGQLSSVELICKCQTPANPDKTLIGCTNPDCGKWLHHECLSHDVLMRVYDRLGTDKPHIKEELGAKDAVDQRTTRPLSPTDTGDKETQPTIDVRSGDVQDNVLVRRTEEEIPRQVQTPTPVPQSQTSDSATKSSTAKKGRKKKSPESKPYEGLFQATLKMTDGPTMWEIEDLREDVTGGMKKWREQANCLLCNTTID